MNHTGAFAVLKIEFELKSLAPLGFGGEKLPRVAPTDHWGILNERGASEVSSVSLKGGPSSLTTLDDAEALFFSAS